MNTCGIINTPIAQAALGDLFIFPAAGRPCALFPILEKEIAATATKIALFPPIPCSPFPLLEAPSGISTPQPKSTLWLPSPPWGFDSAFNRGPKFPPWAKADSGVIRPGDPVKWIRMPRRRSDFAIVEFIFRRSEERTRSSYFAIGERGRENGREDDESLRNIADAIIRFWGHFAVRPSPNFRLAAGLPRLGGG